MLGVAGPKARRKAVAMLQRLAVARAAVLSALFALMGMCGPPASLGSALDQLHPQGSSIGCPQAG